MADQASSIYNRYSEANDGIAHFSRTSSVRRCQHTDWDICESVRLQELQEARERAAQMEKTMRWWSECTAGWRAKWSVVRDERNRAREEGQSLRSALLQAHEKIDGLQGEKREVEMELQKTKTALHKLTVSHLQANKPVDEIPKEEERIDESTETEIEVLTVQTQTDDVAHADSFEVMSPSSRSFLAGPFTSRERNAFEERCSDLQGQLIDSRNMVAELEAVREALKDEIVELRRCQPTINGVQYRKDATADDSERARTDSRNMTVKQWQMVVPIVHITDEDAQ